MGRRMAQAGQRSQDGPDQPRRPVEDAGKGQDGEHQVSQRPRPPAKQGIGHVPAVELAQRQQVERRQQHTKPRRQRHRVKQDGPAQAAFHQRRADRLQQERHPHPPEGQADRRAELDRRQQQPDHKQRQRHDQPGQRPADPHVEQRPARLERATDEDHRTQRAQAAGDRQRDEERQRDLDPVAARGHVMAHLVHAQDEQQRQGERPARRQRLRQPQSRAVEQDRRGIHRGGDGRQQQGDVQPQRGAPGGAHRPPQRAAARLDPVGVGYTLHHHDDVGGVFPLQECGIAQRRQALLQLRGSLARRKQQLPFGHQADLIAARDLLLSLDGHHPADRGPQRVGLRRAYACLRGRAGFRRWQLVKGHQTLGNSMFCWYWYLPFLSA